MLTSEILEGKRLDLGNWTRSTQQHKDDMDAESRRGR